MIGCLRMWAGSRAILMRAKDALQVVGDDGIIRVPGARPLARGALVLQGRVVPVFDLARLELPGMESPGPAPRRGSRPAIVIMDAEGAMLGLMVDRTETIRASEEQAARTIDARQILEAAMGHPGGLERAATAAGEP